MTEDHKPGVIKNQNVTLEKVAFARSLRRDMSPVERRLWHRLRARQICGAKFRRQQIIGSYIADFYCAEATLAIEVDGDTHDPEQDKLRDQFFRSKGVCVLRFTNAQVIHELEAVLQVIAEALSSTCSPTSP
jgi:very-short-patch-repair endonuclease